MGLPSRHRVGAACRLQPPCSLPALGGVLHPPSLSASASEKRRSYELGHYRQSRLTVCPNRAKTGSDPSAADCRPRCRWPLLELSAFKVRSRTLRHHQLHAILRENTLLHREALLVLSAQDLQDVASELLTDILAIHLSREPLVVERAPVGSEGVELRRASQTDLLHCVRAANAGVRAAAGQRRSAQLLLILNLDELLLASRRIGNVELRGTRQAAHV